MARLKSTLASEVSGICEGDWCLKAESFLVPQDVVWAQVPKRVISLLNTLRVWSPSQTCNPDPHHVHQEIGWEVVIDMNIPDFPP